MRFVTWNIGGAFISPRKDLIFDVSDLDYFVNELNKVGAEIISLQETHSSQSSDQAKYIAHKLGFGHSCTFPIADSHLVEGELLSISIISKYPIHSSKYIKLRNPLLKNVENGHTYTSHDKGLVEAVIEYKKGMHVTVFSGHMVPFHVFSRNFSDADFKDIREEVEEILLSAKNPCVAGIDLNFNLEKQVLPRIFEKCFTSLTEGMATTPKGRMYDKILVSPQWKVNDVRVILGKADHYMCFAEVELI